MRIRLCVLLSGTLLLYTARLQAAEFETAYAAYQAGDYQQASREFRTLARQEHARSQYLLGLLYLNGQGVRQSPAQGIDWLKRAAQNGHYLAAVELGQIYSSGRGVALNTEEAAKWIALSTRLAKDEDADQGCD